MLHFWTLSIVWDSSGDMVPDDGLDDRGLEIPGGERDGFSLLQRFQTRFRTYSVSRSEGTGCPFCKC